MTLFCYYLRNPARSELWLLIFVIQRPLFPPQRAIFSPQGKLPAPQRHLLPQESCFSPAVGCQSLPNLTIFSRNIRNSFS